MKTIDELRMIDVAADAYPDDVHAVVREFAAGWDEDGVDSWRVTDAGLYGLVCDVLVEYGIKPESTRYGWKHMYVPGDYDNFLETLCGMWGWDADSDDVPTLDEMQNNPDKYLITKNGFVILNF